MHPAVEILFEDNHLLVVNKPAGLATMGSGEAASVHRWACQYIRDRYHKPGKVYLGVVHRLDAMTSGILVLARTSKAASRLSEQFRNQVAGPEKVYLAVVGGRIIGSQGSFCDRLIKDDAAHRMRLASRITRGGQGSAGTARASSAEPGVEAMLDYRVLRQAETNSGRGRGGTDYSLIAVRLRTGRKHQIRVQFADRGHIVWGDAKYGDRHNRLAGSDASGIALHAASLKFDHPVGGRQMNFRCQPPPSWGRFLPTPQEWDAALAPWDDGPASPRSQDLGQLK